MPMFALVAVFPTRFLGQQKKFLFFVRLSHGLRQALQPVGNKKDEVIEERTDSR